MLTTGLLATDHIGKSRCIEISFHSTREMGTKLKVEI
jgi:hypothetical protein